MDDVLASLPIVDGHCHPWLRPAAPLTAEQLLACFTESREPAMVAAHVPHTLFAHQALADLAGLLGCPPDAGWAAVCQARAGVPLTQWVQRLTSAARLRGVLMDTGYPVPEAGACTVGEMAEALRGTGCTVWPVLRLEPLLERLLAETSSFDDCLTAWTAALSDLRRQGYVALKTIVAYRTGLAVQPVPAGVAAVAYAEVASRAREQGRLRVASKPLLDFFLWEALRAAARQGIPVQFHTGFGDADLDLLQANPLLLRPVLVDAALRGAPVVLLHCYPYVREAAYLASLYAHVYFDLSLAIPLLGPVAARAVEEALGLAPATKVLYGSDAHTVPDLLWLGTVQARRALSAALGRWVRDQALSPSTAVDIVARILAGNARGLYQLPG